MFVGADMAASSQQTRQQLGWEPSRPGLRRQLRDTSVEILELVPPYLQTELTGARQLSDPNAMPVKHFVLEAMEVRVCACRGAWMISSLLAK